MAEEGAGGGKIVSSFELHAQRILGSLALFAISGLTAIVLNNNGDLIRSQERIVRIRKDLDRVMQDMRTLNMRVDRQTQDRYTDTEARGDIKEASEDRQAIKRAFQEADIAIKDELRTSFNELRSQIQFYQSIRSNVGPLPQIPELPPTESDVNEK